MRLRVQLGLGEAMTPARRRKAATAIAEQSDNDRTTTLPTPSGDEHRNAPDAPDAEFRRFEAVLSRVPFAVVVAEAPSGRIVFSNEEAARIYGASLQHPGSVAEYAPSTAFHLDGRPYRVTEYPIVRALEGESVVCEEMDITRADGTRCPVRVTARPVRDGRGHIVAAVGTFEDISRTRKAEQEREDLAWRQRAARIEAEAAHARLALLAEISQFLLASLDYQAAIMGLARLVLPALGDACFVDLEEADSAHRIAIAHVDPNKADLLQRLDEMNGLARLVGRPLASALRTGKPERGDSVQPEDHLGAAGTESGTTSLVAAIGARAYMVIPLVTRGRVLGAMVFLVTESDRKYSGDDLDFAQHVARRAATAVDNLRLYEEAQQARAAAEEANRLKDEFLATLSHELRTPLNAILGWARMLRSRVLDAGTQGKALETIERNALAQAQIVEDLLDVSRVITGSLRLELQRVDFSNLIEAAIAAVRPAADAKGIRIECSMDFTGPVIGDPGRLQQVAWNLLSNATKFTPPGGRISVRVTAEDNHVVLRVDDTGAGISPQFLPYVFERFRQGDSTTTRMHGGLGLGLAIVRHLVEQHGGTVAAESAGPGRGSTFIVRIPIRSTLQAHAAPGSPHHSPAPVGDRAPTARLDNVPVLIVDDEPDARDLFAEILRQHGARVRTASSVSQAMEVIKTFYPRVLVADIGMPGEDGYSLIRRLREMRVAIPAIALTAYARPEDRRRVLDAGFEMHVPKPVEPGELIQAIADLAGRS